ncbi:PDDEXK-like family protein [Anaerovorax odorimutans]|uniref:PDDEXK-like family protein n=1 Tax=Anaerovorax odorimutans TaxID=109327 RepID=UPI00041664F1|nr:PD-(D/E)XK nuclease family protein [Anaerovorax odorimutans]
MEIVIEELVQVLVNRTIQIIREDEKKQYIEGGQFNLLSILNVERNEVSTHSAFIFELINPEGLHCQKDAYLRLFVEKVLGINDFDYSTASVYREKFAGIYGRIDILITSSNYKIVIEVKIGAGDQYRQIERYHQYLEKTKRKIQNQKIYYLTLNGSEPSEKSYGELAENDKKQIKMISFKNDIYKWLVNCIQHKQINRVNSAIFQYADLIKKITNSFDKEMNEKVKNIVLESIDNYKAALSISFAVKEARQFILDKFISKLKNRLEGFTIIKKLVEDENFEKYYDLPKNRYAHLTYLLRETKYDDINIYLRIELEWKLYFSLWIAKVDKDGNIDWESRITKEKYNNIMDEYLTDLDEVFKESKQKYCLGWQYLYSKSQNWYDFYEEESEYNVEYLLDDKLLDDEIENIYMELHEVIVTLLK